MPWDGSGNFTRSYNWVNDEAADIDILASRMDGEDDNFSSGIGACLTKNGESKPTATFSPGTTRAYDLGTSALRWRSAYFATDINVQSATAAAATTFAFTDATATRTVTVPDETGTLVLKDASTGIISPSGGFGPNTVQNIGLLPSVNAKALTIALKTKAMADPSAGSPVQIAFRNVTLTTGDYNIRSATAATSIVAPSGATLGFAAAATGYIYVYALDNAGTIEPVISGSNNWDEATVHTTTAITTGADSGLVLYSTTARTNVPIRYLGRVKITTGAVAGEWDNEDTEVYVGTQVTPSTSNTQTFTASGTWVKPAGFDATATVLVRAWGAGGSGGAGASNTVSGGGGGGGAYAEVWKILSDFGASETITIGAGGAAVSGTTHGNAGGNTTIGSLVTAYGGGGGASGAASGGGGGGGTTGAGASSTTNTGGAGGIPTDTPRSYFYGGGAGGDQNAGAPTAGGGANYGGGGGGGGDTDTVNTTGTGGNSTYGGGGGGGAGAQTAGASGGSSIYGGAGGAGGYDTNNGTAGTQPGGGGGGAENATSGAGGNGKVIITVF